MDGRRGGGGGGGGGGGVCKGWMEGLRSGSLM